MATCPVCFRHCEIRDGAVGFCGGRTAENGITRAYNYGKITGLALDPIEKKPLARFFPGSRILSVGSFGCNLRCPFCQNYEISWSEEVFRYAESAEELTPEKLIELALGARSRGNIGIAFTYNEPLIGYEYVRDAAALAKAEGLKVVLVTNGTAEPEILETLAPSIDAMNIDLKGFSEDFYRDLLGGSLGMVRRFIEKAVKTAHVELTTLVIPGENDSEEAMREESRWIATLRNPDGESVPLHVSRFFPRFHMTDRGPTEVETVYRLADVAREVLPYVYVGNC
ncbi:MAG: AmmeMemoRadiSam system radical SAM enzyme [Lachnospiraceae bacterium]|nr:AmmeMemoRadiSam system radical SAM enzyme [Lachnospiraceae bacterium]